VISCAAGPTVAAGAPLASDNDNPAAPNNGTAHARCFRFEACLSDMMESSISSGKDSTNRRTSKRAGTFERLSDLTEYCQEIPKIRLRFAWGLEGLWGKVVVAVA
jgi:hypothetical protein